MHAASTFFKRLAVFANHTAIAFIILVNKSAIKLQFRQILLSLYFRGNPTEVVIYLCI